ncbi:ATP-synt-DE-N domain-containing protein [Mycena kentingensis (nom. inval.)]|nr:ATP-synt-DE-N domain-containing protein [Mycena kentingensis (nom. inval.)]
MSSDFALVDPRGWEYDLHSVYSAYIGYFQLHNIQWYERSWGPLFSSFEEFVTFSWPVITVTDTWTGKPHIVTRLTSIGAFLKMIKTRYGETLPQAPNILQVTPMETSSRHLRTVSDYSTYKKLYATLPAVYLSALKVRVRAGEPKAIRDLWAAHQHTFLAVDFEWSERNEKSCLEWGYAAIRCAHLDAAGVWPPVPDSNYRKGHYVVNEYVDVHNKHCPTHPWEYSFGESQVCPKTKLPGIIQAMISSLASPDSETTANTLVLVAHGVSGDLSRMEDMKIKLPHNLLIIDTAAFERALYSAGHRNSMIDPHTSKPRAPGSTLSLENLLRSLPAPPPAEGQPLNPAASLPQLPPAPGIYPQLGAMIPGVVAHCSGNDAFMCLYALQLLLEPEGTQAPVPKKLARPASWSAPAFMGQMPMMTGNGMAIGGMGALTADFSGLAMHSRQRSRSPGPTLAVPGYSPGNNGRSSKRLSVAPVGDGWSTVRRG